MPVTILAFIVFRFDGIPGDLVGGLLAGATTAFLGIFVLLIGTIKSLPVNVLGVSG